MELDLQPGDVVKVLESAALGWVRARVIRVKSGGRVVVQSDQGREFTEGMTGYHIRLYLVDTFISHNGMQENGGLRYIGATKVFFGSKKHTIRETKAEQFVSLLYNFLSKGRLIVIRFGHTRKLSALSGKNKCMLHSKREISLD